MEIIGREALSGCGPVRALPSEVQILLERVRLTLQI
jgi:hypothetical protein